MKLYLAGAMSGLPLLNKAQFDKYEEKYVKLGHQVFNPHRISDKYPHLKEIEYMGIDIQQLSVSDAIIIIPNWTESKGATMEVYFALRYGLPVYCAEAGLQINWSDVKFNVKISIHETDKNRKSISDV